MLKCSKMLAVFALTFCIVISLSYASSGAVSVEKVMITGNSIPTGNMQTEVAIKNYDNITRSIELNETLIGPDSSIISSSMQKMDVSAGDLKLNYRPFTLAECSIPGEYIETAKILENGAILSTMQGKFRVDNKFIPRIEKSVYRDLFYTRVNISIKNIGNVRGETEINDEVYGSLFFGGDIPSSINGVKYKWVREIGPCETKDIIYFIDYTILLVPVAFVIILLILWFVFFRFVLVRITKKIHQEKQIEEGGDFTVSLHVRSDVNIKNVEVKDFVPSIFEVIDTPGITPIRNSTNSGTELVWRFNNLSSGEVRILDYKIKPMIAVIGKVRLPSARVIFNCFGKKFIRTTKRAFVGTNETDKE